MLTQKFGICKTAEATIMMGFATLSSYFVDLHATVVAVSP